MRVCVWVRERKRENYVRSIRKQNGEEVFKIWDKKRSWERLWVVGTLTGLLEKNGGRKKMEWKDQRENGFEVGGRYRKKKNDGIMRDLMKGKLNKDE